MPKTGGHARAAKQAKVLQALKAGNTRKASYQYAGVPERTFFDWMEDSSFSQSVMEAEATAEITCAATILNCARKGDWRAADKWLTKRRRDEWSDEISFRDLSTEQLLELVRRGETGIDSPGDRAAVSGAESSGVSD